MCGRPAVRGPRRTSGTPSGGCTRTCGLGPSAAAALERMVVKGTGRAPLFGDGGVTMVTFSNWTKARLFETDFSAAVVAKKDRGGGGSSSKVGRPSYTRTAPFMDDGLALQGVTSIIGKDDDGNYWLQPMLEKGVWDRIGYERC
ncbi:hypothetical protein SLS62_003739 [Diatrype stigma]|uniref:Uncharacterized protein n=1 Tax=Diatrype stigma TaxID=117547 RepID=A0AAN9UVV9_9PEZI